MWDTGWKGMVNKIFHVAMLVLLCSLCIVVGILCSRFLGLQVQKMKDELYLVVPVVFFS